MYDLPTRMIDDLCQIGVIVKNNSGLTTVNAEAQQALELFAPLLQSFEIRLVPVPVSGCPIHFCTGILKVSRSEGAETPSAPEAIPAGGQGHSAVRAAVSCIGELAERLSLCSLGLGDVRVNQKKSDQFDVDLEPILGFSHKQQTRILQNWSDKSVEINNSGKYWNELSDRRINVKDLYYRTPAQLPAVGALFEEMPKNPLSGFGVASTIGCAVWGAMKGARERALLELLERDAVAQAWYNRLGITRVAKAELAEILPDNLKSFLDNRPRCWSAVTVKSDMPVHVVAVVSHLRDGKMAAFGSSADWNYSSALMGAVREMLQAEVSLDLMDKAYPESAAAGWDKQPRALRYARANSILEDWPAGDTNGKGCLIPQDVYSYDQLLAALQQKKIRIWEFDATRPDLKVPCIKLFSPELCTWQPRFGKTRLFNGVVEQGLRKTPADEAEFAARPFPF